MRVAWVCALCLTCLAWAPLAVGQQSTLKVAACNPGSVPYVDTDENGKLVGYDIDIFHETYKIMAAEVAAAATTRNPMITPEVAALIGTTPPPIISLSSNTIQNRLRDRAIDIGMCGFFVTRERMELFDYSNFYFASGLQAVVPRPIRLPTFVDVITAVMSTIDDRAQLMIFILLLCVFVFGHLIATAEHMRLGSKTTNFRSGYFEATQDGFWFSIVVLSTVGFGDIFPKKFLSRICTVVWILVSIALMTMFLGIIATNFLNLVLIPKTAQQDILGPSDLPPFKAGTALLYAQNIITRLSPNQTLLKFPTNSQPDVFRSLLNGTIEVAVERTETIQYYNNMEDEFRGKLMPVGSIFGAEGVAFGVSRTASGGPHPVFRLFSIAASQVTRQLAEEDIRRRWFGEQAPAPHPAIIIMMIVIMIMVTIRRTTTTMIRRGRYFGSRAAKRAHRSGRAAGGGCDTENDCDAGASIAGIIIREIIIAP